MTVKGAWEGPAGLELHDHALAPVAELPVREVISATHILTDLTLGLGTAGRIGVSVALLAPLGLALGMPFPLGVKALENRSESLVAWAWGINGYTSVLGSVLCVVLSIALGFNAVVWLGALVYGVAFLAAPKLAAPR